MGFQSKHKGSSPLRGIIKIDCQEINMKAPSKRILGYSWIGILNMLFLQWFFIRLELNVNNGIVTQFNIIFPIIPLTGLLAVGYIPERFLRIKIWETKNV